MTPLLVALAFLQSPAQSDEALYADCIRIVQADGDRGVAAANDWLVKGGGMVARQCLGQAYVKVERWDAAAQAFEQAASEAETAQDPRRSDFWVQAGNARLAAGEAGAARKAFDAALATTTLTPELRGEVHLDRGRAAVAADDLAAARADFDQGLKLVPADPFAWYLSSALALRQNDLARAQKDVAEAVRLAPDEPEILLHAGNVAGASGELDAAHGLYRKAIAAAPGSPLAARAQAAIDANPVEGRP